MGRAFEGCAGVAGVAEVLSALDAEDVGGLPDAVLRDDLLALMVAVNRLHAQVLRRVEAFDARGLAAEDGCRTARSWLRAFGRLSGHVASAWVKAARALRHLPALAEATVAGRVPAEQIGRVVALVDRVGVGPVRDVDRVLADAATRLDPGGLQQVCDRVRAHVDPDGAEPDAHVDYRRRAITVSPFDGMMLVRGQLDPEGGAALLTALDAMTPPPAGGDDRTPAQRRADALVELARGALTSGSVPVVGGVRPQIAIVLTPDVLGRPMSERALAGGEAAPIRAVPGRGDIARTGARRPTRAAVAHGVPARGVAARGAACGAAALGVAARDAVARAALARMGRTHR